MVQYRAVLSIDHILTGVESSIAKYEVQGQILGRGGRGREGRRREVRGGEAREGSEN